MSEEKNSSIDKITKFITAITGLIAVLITVYQLTKSGGDSTLIVSEPTTPISTQASEVQVIENNDQRPQLKIIHEGEKYWAKEGYGLKMDSLYNLVPFELNNSETGIRITDSNNVIVLEKRLAVGKWLVFQNDISVYKITLTKIGRAGKNPLNKAAFFKVEKGQL